MTGSDVHDMSYYQKCMMGGILSCGITHTIVCPLDIVKCRMQVSTHHHLKLRTHFYRVFPLGLPRTLRWSWRWIQTNQSSRGTQGFHSRKYNTIIYDDMFRDGPQLSSGTPCKVSESSDSTRCSRMSTDGPLVTTLPSTKPLVSPSLLPVPRSSPIASSAQWKP